ncbi:hypothetical protein [Streptomyces sp. I6]|uniref:hypothetical protein n=1 Tax=Streptomyces sp. I6 TaxID=2483113 RepID=UPI0028807482|nr:hypothetical protein [Streptomyces sp. I6]
MTTQQAPSLAPAGPRAATVPLIALCGAWAATRLGTTVLLVTDGVGISGVSTGSTSSTHAGTACSSAAVSRPPTRPGSTRPAPGR